MDVIGVTGLALSAAGFAVAIWQIQKTKSAAEAARDSAADAVLGVRKMYAVSTLHDISGRSRNLLNLIKSTNLTAAAAAAFELRDAVSKFQGTSDPASIESQSTWSALAEEAYALHERLESIALANRWTTEEREDLIHRVSRLHSQFTSSATRLAAEGAKK